jgi:hypothetical protein
MGRASSPYDGTWEGSVRGGYRAHSCQGLTNVTVRDGRVEGISTFQRGRARIRGTIDATGAFHGTHSGVAMTGRFDENSFNGTYAAYCGHSILVLHRVLAN